LPFLKIHSELIIYKIFNRNTNSGEGYDPGDAEEEHHAPDAQHIADEDPFDPSEFVSDWFGWIR